MWRRLVDWYDELEMEQIAVLERPELAEQVRPGWRRWNAKQLAAMTPIERERLRAFSMAYRGPRLHKALAKWAALFTLLGALVHLAFGAPGLVAAVVAANLAGFLLISGAISLWLAPNLILKAKGQVVIGAVGGTLLGAFCGFAAFMLADGKPLEFIYPRVSKLLVGAIVGGLVLAVPTLAVSAWRRRQLMEQAAQLQREAERERMARELSESRLRMLRAQIEPHFLFNTLGAVQQLAADGAPRAAALTADLIAFLRASFSDMRCEQVSLGNEFFTVASYLRVMQARMGARLRFEVSLPAHLESAQVPSMIVLTLAENAIKHGIEPSLRGGEIRISAAAHDGSLLLRVQDTGVGMNTAADNGTGDGNGLDNVRRRLQLAYGEAASLSLRDADPGLVAELKIPVSMKEPA
ncbi:sensor histidine kinase [Massilia consociata]|uniref:Sensor histidine kinase n=1 Tax=Massilia consociata TaxID=760117 RepID=A0ABV6FF61_9BURK